MPLGLKPTVYIDGQSAQSQGYTEDAKNYYVWYTTKLVMHQILILFTHNQTQRHTTQPQTIYGIAAGVAIGVTVLFLLILVVKSKRKARAIDCFRKNPSMARALNKNQKSNLSNCYYGTYSLRLHAVR